MTERTRSDSPTKLCTLDGCGRALRARGLCSTHYNQQLQTKQQRHAKTETPCVICGRLVLRDIHATPRYRRVCSPACRSLVQSDCADKKEFDWTVDAIRRAVRAGADVIEAIDRILVFERDGWACYRCGITVRLGDCFALDSATIDHVIPLSHRGQHTMENVGTCCLSCNSAKQARVA